MTTETTSLMPTGINSKLYATLPPLASTNRLCIATYG